MRNRIIAVVALLASVATAQSDPSTVLARARSLYQSGDFDGVIATVQAYTRTNGTDPANEYLVPLLVEALVRKEEFGLGQRLMNIYKRKYAESRFMPRMWYLDGYMLSKQQEYVAAMESFSQALSAGVSVELDSLVTSNVIIISRGPMTASELATASAARSTHERLREIVRFYEVEKLYAAGQTTKAKQRAETFRTDYPRSKFVSSVKETIGKAKRQERDQVQIGLLAPLSGFDADIGKQIVQGVQTAVDRYNAAGSRPEVSLVISDTRGNMIETAKKTSELLNDHKVSLLIGPVLSPNAVVAAGMLMGRSAVMISPTASEEGISDLGPNVFQMNVTVGSLGRKIASYAIENLTIKEFAILAPSTEYGQAQAKRFKDEVIRNGGEVIAEEAYEEGSPDFRRQFASLRAKILIHHHKTAAAQRGEVFTPTARSRQIDSVKYADSTLLVGGLFIPGEADDVVMLTAQAAFHRIRAQLLGTSGWRSDKVLNQGKQHVNNAIIAVNAEPSTDNPKWIEFRDNYRKRFRNDPDQVAALGYDATQLLLNALQQNGGDPDPAAVAKSLSGVRGFEGASGKVSFGPHSRSNTEAVILKISDKRFLRVQ